MMLRETMRALLGHWRRHPVELVTMLVGLALATALWSGVQALNAQARDSYAQAAAVLGEGAFATIVARDGQRFDVEEYAALRRAGWPVSPVLEGEIVVGGSSIRVVGVEPVTLPEGATGPRIGDEGDRLTRFLTPPHLGLVGPGDPPEDPRLPPLETVESLPPNTLLVDIGVAERLLDAAGRISRLLVEPGASTTLPENLAGRLEFRPAQAAGDLDRLTNSFHLNLTAFGFLSFFVGLFIVYSAIGLAFEQRRPMLRTLRACGVPVRCLTLALLLELMGLALLAGLVGVLGGYAIAAALLPDVAASLRELYGARVPGSLSLSPWWWLAGLGVAGLGALAASASALWRAWRLPLLTSAQPQAWFETQRRSARFQLVAAALLSGIALLAVLYGDGLVTGFALMGAVLLAAALGLPALLSAILEIGARRAMGPVAEWLWADARQQVSGLSLALMALMLALAVNIGVGTMVDSFRRTFLGWLDQRLAAELYLTGANTDEAAAMAGWLEAQPDVRVVLPIWSVESRFRDWPTEIFGFRDDETYRDNWPLLTAAPDAWDAVAAGEAVLVSEQLARRFDVGVGDQIEIATPEGPWSVDVAAVYSDYGNPEGQILVGLDQFDVRWPEAERRRMGVRLDPERVDGLIAGLRQEFGLGEEQFVRQATLKAFSRLVFERTFAVTMALNALTLLVAGVALLASLLTLSTMRIAQLAPLWALGLTRRRLAGLEIAKTVGLAALTALAALPLGLAVAWVLTAVINVQAFGWRLPIHFFPGKWAMLFGMAIATAFAAAVWPALRLRRASPLSLLRSFSSER